MRDLLSFSLEAGAVVVAWGTALGLLYRAPRLHAGSTPQRRAMPAAGYWNPHTKANARGVSILLGAAAITLVWHLYAVQVGGHTDLTLAGCAGCAAGLGIDRLLGRRWRGSPAEPAVTRAGEAARRPTSLRGRPARFPVLPVIGLNVTVPLVCLWYYEHGQPGPRMIAIAAITYAIMNSVAIFVWTRMKGRE